MTRSFVLLSFALAWLSACSSGPPPRRNSQIKNSPYEVGGQWYEPLPVEQAQGFEEVGRASWYGPDSFMGGSGTTANGEEVNSASMSAAHKHLPLPSTIEVENLENGQRAVLRVNDRGPFVPDRILDVSSRAAEVLGFKQRGITTVRVRVLRVGDA